MIAAAPRKKANGDATMRPWRIGTRAGVRVFACSRSSATGSARSGAGAHFACEERGATERAALPRAALVTGAIVPSRAQVTQSRVM